MKLPQPKKNATETIRIRTKAPRTRGSNARKTVETTITETATGERSIRTRTNNQQLKRIQREIRKLKQSDAGPPVQSVMDVTITLGVIRGSDNEDLSRQARIWTNPTLLKPADSGTTPTPLTTRGSQYNMWKPMSAFVVFQPLVGKTNITGTLILSDVDQECSAAKPESIDTVKARMHVEVQIGSYRKWHVPKKCLQGPRQGWWYIDTNENPTQSMGPALNFWTYMSTKNLLSVNDHQTNHYDGPLALVELTIRYGFSNYNPKPALSQLETGSISPETATKTKFVNMDDGTVALEMEVNGAFYDFFSARGPLTAGTGDGKKDSSIWSVASTAVEGIAGILGPWGWLLKGGWFLIRKIFKAPGARTNTIHFSVYSSVEDAQRDEPIRTKVQSIPTYDSDNFLPAGAYTFRQLQAPNLATNADSAYIMRSVVQYQHDWLPTAHAGLPEVELTPFYRYDDEEGYTPGIPNKMQDYETNNWNGYDNLFTITGRPTIYAKKVVGSGNKITLLANPESSINASWRGEITFTQQTNWLCLVDYDSTTTLIGQNEYGTYGMIHSKETFMRALTQAWERNRTFDKSRPWQVWSKLENTTQPSVIDDIMAMVFTPGEHCYVTPVGPNGNTWGDKVSVVNDKLVGDLDARGFFFANLTKQKLVGLVCISPWQETAVEFFNDFNLIYFSNWGTNDSNRKKLFQVKLIDNKMPNYDSGIEVIDEEYEIDEDQEYQLTCLSRRNALRRRQP